MIRFVICCLILFNINAVFAASYHLVRRQPAYRYANPMYNNYYNAPVLSSSDLSALEKYTLNRAYPRENPIKRLERLENLAFGSIQQGDLQNRYNNVEKALLARPNYNTKRTALGNILNYFAGQATGVTPSLSTNSNYYIPNNYGYDNFIPSYGNQRFNQYSNGIFGHGYSIMNSSLGNGSSVTVLP